MQSFLKENYGESLCEKLADNQDLSGRLARLTELQEEGTWQALLTTHLDQAFDHAVQSQPDYLQDAIRSARDGFFATEGPKLLQEFLDSGAGLFELPISVEVLDGPSKAAFQTEWNLFTREYAADPAAGTQALQADILDMWTLEMQSYPVYITENARAALRETWLMSKICSILRNVVQQRRFKPPVNFAEMPISEQTEAKAAWKSFLQGMQDGVHDNALEDLQAVSEAKWNDEKQKFPSYCDKKFLACAEQTWLKQNFTTLIGLASQRIPVVAGVTRDAPASATGKTCSSSVSLGDSQSSTVVQSTEKTCVGENQPSSHDSGRRVKRRVSGSGETSFVTCEQIRSGQIDLSQKLCLRACIMQWPDSQADSAKKGFNIIVGDETGIVQATAWGAAKEEMQKHEPGEEHEDFEQGCWISVEGFKVHQTVNAMPGMKTIAFTQGVTISIVDAPSEPFHFCPPASAYQSRFADLGKQPLPFVANFAGVIFELTGTACTEQGQNILSFKIQDKEFVLSIYTITFVRGLSNVLHFVGHFHDLSLLYSLVVYTFVLYKDGDLMKVLALGRYADFPSMEKGSEIVVFFAKAQKSKKADQASVLWIYSDSYVHVLRGGTNLLPCRREVLLQEI